MIGVIERVDASQTQIGDVIDITESGAIIVAMGGEEPRVQRCDLLVTSESTPPVLGRGDRVLTWVSADGASAVVLGRIGPSRAVVAEASELPDTLTIEAKHSLTLRVGDGSVTIREDGKILIKGKDLVSHAQRMNRIKGGAVAIN